MYKSMGAKHGDWQLSQNNQYVSYALLSLGSRIAQILGSEKAMSLMIFHDLTRGDQSQTSFFLNRGKKTAWTERKVRCI